MKIAQLSAVGCLLIVTTSLPVLADMFTPSHSCAKPYKPYQFNSQWEVDNFNDGVGNYKRCMSDFIDEQNDAAKKHQEAANDAIGEWNNFVNYELN